MVELWAVARDCRFEIHDLAAWAWIVDIQKALAVRVGDWANHLLDQGASSTPWSPPPGVLSELGAQFREGKTVDAALETCRSLALEDGLGATGPVRLEHLRRRRRHILRHPPPLVIDRRVDATPEARATYTTVRGW